MDIIYNKELTNDRLRKVRDIFIFQASTGLSYIDMATLTSIEETPTISYIKGRRHKTKTEYTSVILKRGIEIWHKYNGKLPVLSNQKYNAYLKELADICGIDKVITTHIARKTYATTLLNKGISLPSVAKALGHSNITTTQRSYATLLDTTIFNEFQDKKL